MLNRCSGYVIVNLAAEPWLLTLFYFGSFCFAGFTDNNIGPRTPKTNVHSKSQSATIKTHMRAWITSIRVVPESNPIRDIVFFADRI
jgi:hypothetical protein